MTKSTICTNSVGCSLKGFVDPDVVRKMLAIARDEMGDDADSNPRQADAPAEADGEEQGGLAYFNVGQSAGLTDPVMRPLIDEVGKSASVLQRRRAPDGTAVGTRYYADFFAPKLPSTKTARHGGTDPPRSIRISSPSPSTGPGA